MTERKAPSRRTLWPGAWDSADIPAYPTYTLLAAKAGDNTNAIVERVKVGLDQYSIVTGERPAIEGEVLFDEEMMRIPDVAENILYRMQLWEQAERDRARQEMLRQICRSDILFFINTFVWIGNPRQRTTVPFVTFPYQDECITWIVDMIARHKDGLIEKSREMGYTWMVEAICAWLVLFTPDVAVYQMSLKEDDVDDKTQKSLLGKFRFILGKLPPWMHAGWDAKNSQLDKHMKITFPATNSLVTGILSQGAAGRGGRATWLLWDEAAHSKADEQVLTALASLSASSIIGSTPLGMGNEFARMAFDPRTDKRTLHYTLHPLKTKEWRDVERNNPRYTEETWSQEHEIRYETSTAGRVFPQLISFKTDEIQWTHIQDGEVAEYDPDLPVDTGQDYGISDPCAIVFAQVKTAPAEFHRHTKFTLVFFAEFERRNMDAYELRWFLNEQKYNYRFHVGDARSGTARNSSRSSWTGDLAKMPAPVEYSHIFRQTITPGPPVVVNVKRSKEDKTIDQFVKLLNTPGAIAINKFGCPRFVRCLQNWAKPLDRDTGQPISGSSPNHDDWSHLSKAALYLVDFLYDRLPGNEIQKETAWDYPALTIAVR